jgi:hypothetical protein
VFVTAGIYGMKEQRKQQCTGYPTTKKGGEVIEDEYAHPECASVDLTDTCKVWKPVGGE